MNSPKVILRNYNYIDAVTNELKRLNSEIITLDNANVFEQLVHPLQGIKQIFKWSQCQSSQSYQQCNFKDYYTHMWLAIRDCKDAIILCKTIEGNVFGLEYHKEGDSYVYSINLNIQIRTKTTVVYHYSELSVTNEYFKLIIAQDYRRQWQSIAICQTNNPQYDGYNTSEIFSNKLPSDYWGRDKYILDILDCEVYEYDRTGLN